MIESKKVENLQRRLAAESSQKVDDDRQKWLVEFLDKFHLGQQQHNY